MNNSEIRELSTQEFQYAVGAPLYCPASNAQLAVKILAGSIDAQTVIIDLEDSILPQQLESATVTMEETLRQLNAANHKELPLLFIRVRSAGHLEYIYERFYEYMDIITGFVLPKYDTSVAREYRRTIQRIDVERKKYYMPIMESAVLLSSDHLRELKEINKYFHDGLQPLCILTGGNDLCRVLHMRRHCAESIFGISAISNILGDIVAEFGSEWSVSGPISEYFDGAVWQHYFEQETRECLNNGFIGRACVHPNQIGIVRGMLRVLVDDVRDAEDILQHSYVNSGVFKSRYYGRMNEYATNVDWAKRTVTLSKIYGVREE